MVFMQALSMKERIKEEALSTAMNCWRNMKMSMVWKAWAPWAAAKAAKHNVLNCVILHWRNRAIAKCFKVLKLRTARKMDLRARLAAAQGQRKA